MRIGRWAGATVTGLAFILASCESDPTGSERARELEITAPSAFVDVGQTLELSAVAKDVSGVPVEGVRLIWSTSDHSVLEVSQGAATGRAPGSAYVRVSAGAVADSLLVTVEAPVVHVLVTPDVVSLPRGRSTRLSVRLLDAEQAPASHSVRFTSSAPEAVEVSDSGVVQGKSRGSAVVTVTAGLTAIQVPVHVESGYTAIALPGLTDTGEARANAINEGGLIVGRARGADGAMHAVLWENGAIRDLGTLGRAFNEAVAVNDSGVVIGNARRIVGLKRDLGPALNTQPWRWRDGVLAPIDITPPFYVEGTLVTDINNPGQISGYAFLYDVHDVKGEAFLWSDGGMQWLGTFGTSISPHWTVPQAPHMSVASSVNDAGLVAGSMVFYAYEEHPAVWQSGQWREAGPPAFTVSRAVAANNKGQVVAVSGSPECPGMYLWEKGGSTCLSSRDMPVSPVPSDGGPRAINNLGQIVGISNDGAFLWSDGRFMSLDPLVLGGEWEIQGATGINDRGQIVGWGRNRRSGVIGALLLEPVR